MASAAEIAKGWTSRKVRHEEDDLKGLGLPKNVQEAILDVEACSHDLAERIVLAEQLWAEHPEHDLALEPGGHRQTTWAQRFEEVGGDIVEIVKESHDSPVRLIARDDLHAAADPASALQARLRANGNQAE
jgi:hypothetical protein